MGLFRFTRLGQIRAFKCLHQGEGGCYGLAVFDFWHHPKQLSYIVKSRLTSCVPSSNPRSVILPSALIVMVIATDSSAR